MPETPWVSLQFILRAEIGDIVFDDIVAFKSTTQVNAIPSAELVVAVGRDVNRSQPATIHRAIARLNTNQKAKVYLTVRLLGASPGYQNEFPENEFLVFEGFAIGTSPSRTTSGASFIIRLAHWTAALDYASCVSPSSHPGNPFNFAYNQAQPDLRGNQATGATQAKWITMSFPPKAVANNDVEEDFWGLVLLPWMENVAGMDKFATTRETQLKQVNSQEALDALKRFAPRVDIKDAVKAGVELRGADGISIADSISKTLYEDTFQSWAMTTLWGKLVGQWAPQFSLIVVPRVTDALVVPFVAGLRQPFKTEIKASDYSECHSMSTMPRVPRMVGILHSAEYFRGSNLGPPNGVTNQVLAGKFEVAGDGVTRLLEAPRWLSHIVNPQSDSADAAGAKRKPIGMAIAPNAGEAPQREGAKPQEAQNAVMRPDGILDAYAQGLFVLEMLKGRIGEIAGKLRFDLAPGSTVKIEAAKEQFLGEEDGLAAAFYATILQVSHTINAATARAGTSFTIANIRNETENEDDKTSIDKPPFYKEAWPGAALIDFD